MRYHYFLASTDQQIDYVYKSGERARGSRMRKGEGVKIPWDWD